MLKNKVLIISIIVILLGFYNKNPDKPNNTKVQDTIEVKQGILDVEYELYSVVINSVLKTYLSDSVFIYPRTGFMCSLPDDYKVQISWQFDCCIDLLNYPGLDSIIDKKTEEDFINKNKYPYELTNNFKVNSNYRIQKRKKYFSYNFGFSRIGFNDENNEAFLYVFNLWGPMAATEDFYFFIRHENRWIIKGILNISVS